MKYAREIKVAILVILCGCLVYFGLYFLKGVNIFTQEYQYIGLFENVAGLTEQAPVYVRGYKVGQVDRIQYDFTKSQAFTVTISIHKDIVLSDSAQMRLVDDGLLGGKAIEVVVPAGELAHSTIYASGDTLPTTIVPGLLTSLQEGLIAKVDDAISNIDALVVKVNQQIGDSSLQQTLSNVEHMSADLSASARDIKKVAHDQLPGMVSNADSLLADAKVVVRDIQDANLSGTVARIDLTLDTVQSILTQKDGTLGLLLNDKQLYQHVDSTIVSLDHLVVDLKANPKRYVHFSLFGGKDKEKKSK
ncbi:MAG: MlaD family protein [Paludibacteraceae bacterium]|nr:MlaD family protein [Paludibacteraceae bacterium]